jgi:hypothetical protein
MYQNQYLLGTTQNCADKKIILKKKKSRLVLGVHKISEGSVMYPKIVSPSWV